MPLGVDSSSITKNLDDRDSPFRLRDYRILASRASSNIVGATRSSETSRRNVAFKGGSFLAHRSLLSASSSGSSTSRTFLNSCWDLEWHFPPHLSLRAHDLPKRTEPPLTWKYSVRTTVHLEAHNRCLYLYRCPTTNGQQHALLVSVADMRLGYSSLVHFSS